MWTIVFLNFLKKNTPFYMKLKITVKRTPDPLYSLLDVLFIPHVTILVFYSFLKLLLLEFCPITSYNCIFQGHSDSIIAKARGRISVSFWVIQWHHLICLLTLATCLFEDINSSALSTSCMISFPQVSLPCSFASPQSLTIFFQDPLSFF